jgi:hypothetical protein
MYAQIYIHTYMHTYVHVNRPMCIYTDVEQSIYPLLSYGWSAEEFPPLYPRRFVPRFRGFSGTRSMGGILFFIGHLFLIIIEIFFTYAFLASLYGNIWYRFLTPSLVIYISKHHHHQVQNGPFVSTGGMAMRGLEAIRPKNGSPPKPVGLSVISVANSFWDSVHQVFQSISETESIEVCVGVCIHAYMRHIHMPAYIHAYIYKYIHINIYVYLHKYVFTYIHI